MSYHFLIVVCLLCKVKKTGKFLLSGCKMFPNKISFSYLKQMLNGQNNKHRYIPFAQRGGYIQNGHCSYYRYGIACPGTHQINYLPIREYDKKLADEKIAEKAGISFA